MRSVFTFLPERTSRARLIIGWNIALIFTVGTLFSACQNPDDIPRSVSEDVEQSVYIAGEEAEAIGAIDIAAFYRSFLLQFEEMLQESETELESFTEQQAEMLDLFGLDPAADNVLATFSMDLSNEGVIPSLVVMAPLSQDILAEVADEIDVFNELEVTLPERVRGAAGEDVVIYALGDTEDRLMIAQPRPGVLIATPSVRQMAGMVIRSNETAHRAFASEKNLMSLVAGEDAWFFTRDLTKALDAVSEFPSIPEFQRIVSAIGNVAASIRLEPERALFNAYLEPRNDVDVEDLSDLIRGAIAVVKLNTQNMPVMQELIERIDVSESNGFSRVQLDLTESFLETLAELTESAY